jgi:hypothetical protein
MASSYEEIDYRLRPAKHIERKMLCEAFQRLSVFASLDSYRYVGLGSIYFSDFVLVHRILGLRNMDSVEQDVEKQSRFEFNKPYKCITMHYGPSNDELPKLPWDTRAILWLDYDGPLTDSVLTDVSFFCTNARPASFLAVTVNAQPPGKEGKRVEALRGQLAAAKVREDLKEADLAGWQTAVTYRRVITNEIEERLKEMNGARGQGKKLLFQQVVNFQYADGAKMLSIGGVLYDEELSEQLRRCAFEGLPFFRGGEDAYRIEVPKLTFRELRHLDQQLPCDGNKALEGKSIPEGDLQRYGSMYRWFPTFAEAEL